MTMLLSYVNYTVCNQCRTLFIYYRSEYRTFGLTNLRTIRPNDPSDCWPFGPMTIGLLTIRTSDPSDHGPFGLITLRTIELSAVDKPKFMGRPPDHLRWKTGSPKSFLGCPTYFDIYLNQSIKSSFVKGAGAHPQNAPCRRRSHALRKAPVRRGRLLSTVLHR